MFEAWIYPTGDNVGTIISTTSMTGVVNESCDGETSYWSLYRDNDSGIVFNQRDEGNYHKSNILAPKDEWTHIGLRYG